MKCEHCAADIAAPDAHEHAGRTLCEDCCLDVLTAPRACDPWAVYSATRTASREKSLTPLQERMLNLFRAEGPLSQERICSGLGISEAEFRDTIAPLRHMELARACKVGGAVRYTRFEDPAGD
ncbi:hypothetical protein [Desulfococcus sp.]|uniref:hypothetical protein n=1 Tax=Desulfococcus sp. TaxID=2025834 RepID=UPI003592F125